MSRTELSKALGRNKEREDIQRALDVLVAAQLVWSAKESNGERGRDTEKWFSSCYEVTN